MFLKLGGWTGSHCASFLQIPLTMALSEPRTLDPCFEDSLDQGYWVEGSQIPEGRECRSVEGQVLISDPQKLSGNGHCSIQQALNESWSQARGL